MIAIKTITTYCVHIRQEIRQNALAAGLKKVVAYLDDFVSNYTNPEMSEIEIVYSMDTVNKVKKSWRQIQDRLLQNHVMTIEKLKDMNQFIQQSVDDNLPGGGCVLGKYLMKID